MAAPGRLEYALAVGAAARLCGRDGATPGIAAVTANPFRLLGADSPLSFAQVDKVAAGLGIEGRHPLRLAAAASAALAVAEQSGHCGAA